MIKRSVYQGEAKVLPFQIKDKVTGKNLDLTGATFLLWIKRAPEDTTPVFIKEDSDFDKTALATGYVTVFLTAYDTYMSPWIYKGELRVTKTGSPSPIAKLTFELEILKAITPNEWTLAPVGIASQEAFGVPVITD